MCRGKDICDVLGSDPSTWSNQCPLPLPDYFEKGLQNFERAVSHVLEEDIDSALDSIQNSNSELIGEFFIEHGQQSAYFRVQNRKEIDRENMLNKKENTGERLNAGIEKEVFKRDSYRCRYCNQRIVAKEIFSEIGRILGSENFSTERENSKRNGLTLGLRGVADHVEPFASGGETSADNLVTSCYSCNFGKAGYTLEQMGIEDPRLRQPANDSWNGLIEFLPALKLIESRD